MTLPPRFPPVTDTASGNPDAETGGGRSGRCWDRARWEVRGDIHHGLLALASSITCWQGLKRSF
ncbi:MAG TPA: hypothetical protein VNP92_04035 [Actinophytocola sp.]|nr:hypothetical protein [Actinophytocola sp.]